MTDAEILQKAIEKARKNGFDKLGLLNKDNLRPPAFIFSHDFAKAFWNGIETKRVPTHYNELMGILDEEVLPMWAWHLQQMVLEESPIKYLEKFL